MKSSLTQESLKEGTPNRDNDHAHNNTTSRPSLLRSPPERLSDLSTSLAERRNSQSSARSKPQASDDDAEKTKQSNTIAGDTVQAIQTRHQISGSDEERLAKLREGMNAKLQKQGARRSYGASSKSDTSSPRVAAIQEEAGAASPQSLNAMLARTSSNESTESSRTIRASKPSSPTGNPPPRTPSYPFPYVPGTPKWSSQFHQPFTSLSPTTSGGPTASDDSQDEVSRMQSGESTPAATARAFLPPGVSHEQREDPRFPTPNLYEMVLQLNAEPGVEQWWTTVTNLMHNHFKADRATLVVPRDSSEIENVPWGQKATFSMNGPEDFVSHSTIVEQEAELRPKSASKAEFEIYKSSLEDSRPQKLHQGRLRPKLQARHSYAGHSRNVKEASSQARPAGPQRNATHAAGMNNLLATKKPPNKRLLSNSTVRDGSVNDPDFSSIAELVDAGPYAEVFSGLRALNREARPLIEPSGVNRVLERARVVTVTRDYLSENGDPRTDSDVERFDTEAHDEPSTSTTPRPSLANVESYRSFFSDHVPPIVKDYEEYEQYPSSPWSQSPAPSPAIQADEDENPFFSSQEQQVEESFNPLTSPNDYSQLGVVEAIGVDRTNTVIHIPLIHPTISQPMQSAKSAKVSSDPRDSVQRSNTLDMERKTPIAILSILTTVVPFPQNLTQSLTLLGPHLATSFATSEQFSSARPQAVTIRHRRTGTEQSAISAPMTIVPTSLEDIMYAEVEGPRGSISDSISPSEYSGNSPYSTSSSIVGTPGWDPASHGLTGNKSGTSTPALTGSEIVDNYFEAKRRSGKRATSNASAQATTTLARSSKRGSHSERRQNVRTSPVDDASKTVPSELTKGKELPPADANVANSRIVEEVLESSQRTRPNAATYSVAPDHVDSKRAHSQLHSHGADFDTSFGGLPSTAGVEVPTPSVYGHLRKPSYPEDMLPPSERLLRTIIDSVPVQIFTAEPGTGRMTWINSKFMVYRGLEARHVLNDPWNAIHPDDRHEFMATWHRSLRTAQQLQQKVRLQRFDGDYRWFYVRAAPLKDKNQKIVHWIGTMMDFHEQHLAQETAAKQHETAASEAKYRALANSSPQVVFAANRTKGITFCNTQWLQFSGQSEAAARGVGFMEHVHPDDLAKCKLPTFDSGANIPRNVPTSVPPDLQRTFSGSAESSSGSSETERVAMSPQSSPVTGQMPQRKLSELAGTGILKFSRDAEGRPSYSTEVRLKSRDGDYKWHLVRVLLAEPLLRNDDDEETWYGTCTDISDHKALERDLKETMDSKSRFLSNMSHEIRTPLNGITGMVNFLIDSSLTTEQMEHVNIIRASTEGLRGLINDILDLSKAEAGMIQLNIDWLYVRSLIEEVNDLTSAMSIDKGLELNYVVEEDVPAQVKGDRFRIRQILLNIVGNAIKFTQHGEVFIRCSVQQADEYELAMNELYIKFEVIDTGQGFTEEEAEHLFQRFRQIDASSTRQHGGTGLGLVISRQLAQLHGGEMTAKGVPGKGSTFTCLIKATQPSKMDQPPTPLPTPGGVNIPILPVNSSFSSTSSKSSGIAMLADGAKPSPKYAFEHTASPSVYGTSPDVGRESPAISSASSDPSVSSAARTSAFHSHRSSASSFSTDQSMKLSLPSDPKRTTAPPQESKLSKVSSVDSPPVESAGAVTFIDTLNRPAALLASPGGNTAPPMFSILVLSPLRYSREATVEHIDKTLPKNVPHQITAKENLAECREMINGVDAVTFTHIVIMLHDVAEIIALMDQVLASGLHQSTSIVIITDLVQKRRIMEQAPTFDYEELATERRLQFVFKPLKPSRFAAIFDPQKEREMSYDRNRDSAQQVALTQKQVFEELSKRLGNRDKRVLLVEDNRTNQLVVLKYLSKVSIAAETAVDGVECTEKVFSKPHDYYSIILCDLHMPNKDGYQTAKDIRRWEKENRYSHIPIIALSANVLPDVHEKCVNSGFNSYLTKPVDFKELSTALMTFMDPSDPSKPHEFMKMKRRRASLKDGRK